MDRDSFVPVQFDAYLTSKWRCQFGNWIYVSGVQRRDLRWRYKFGVIQVQLVPKGMRLDEIKQ